MYKQFKQLNNRKTNNLIKMWGENLNRHFSKEDIQMANTWKDAQHCSLLEKCKLKLQWDITSHQSDWPSSKKPTNNKCWRECGEKGTLLHCRWECKLIQSLWKMLWRFLKKLGIKPPHDPAIPLLSMYPEETKTEKDTCTPMFIAAQFAIVRTWKPPRCPLAGEWIKKLWYIYTMKYYSAIKRNEIGSFVMLWMDLESVTKCHLFVKEEKLQN